MRLRGGRPRRRRRCGRRLPRSHSRASRVTRGAAFAASSRNSSRSARASRAAPRCARRARARAAKADTMLESERWDFEKRRLSENTGHVREIPDTFGKLIVRTSFQVLRAAPPVDARVGQRAGRRRAVRRLGRSPRGHRAALRTPLARTRNTRRLFFKETPRYKKRRQDIPRYA